MLPSVTAALTQLIAPITSAATRPSLNQQKDPEFQQTRKRKRSKQGESPPSEAENAEPKLAPIKAGIVKREQSQNPGDDTSDEDPPQPNLEQPVNEAKPARRESGPSVASTFLELFNLLQTNRFFTRWLGLQAYSSTGKRQKKSTKVRKGLALDERLE